MAEYEFKCVWCGERQIVIKPMNEPMPEVECECGELMRRDYRVAAVHFKGDGWGGSK